MKSFVATSDAVRQPNLPATYFSIKSTQCTREFSPYRRVIRKNSSTTCLASIEYTAPQPSSSRALVSQKSESKRRVHICHKLMITGTALFVLNNPSSVAEKDMIKIVVASLKNAMYVL